MKDSQSVMLPLSGIRVVELADAKSQLCGKVLADFGAEVILVEPPGGCPARSIGPFKQGVPAPESSLYFTYFNTNKKSIVIDLGKQTDRAALRRLITDSDVFLESTVPGILSQWNLDYAALSSANPKLIMTSITGFGQTGPFKNYKCTDSIAYAMGGQMSLTGKPEREPAVPSVELVYPMVAVLSAFGILSALYWRQRSGQGQYIDASTYESLAGPMHQLTNYSSSALIQERRGNRHPTAPGGPYGTFPTKDGRHVHIVVLAGPHWKTFFEWIGSPELLAGPAWEDAYFRAANCDVVDMAVEEFTLQHTMDVLCREGAKRHLMVAPVATPEEFLYTNEQNLSRDYLIEVDHPLFGSHQYPRPPFLSRTPMWKIRRGAPLLAQHREEVLSSAPKAPEQDLVTPPAESDKTTDLRPLEGVRVLDFTHAIAGPLGVQWLTQLGAEVLKVESVHQTAMGRPRPGSTPEGMARSLVANAEHNIGKRSIQVNMGTEEGRKLLRELTRTCDVIVANFSAGVLERWGMDYDSLQKYNPHVILAALSGFGQTGPQRGDISIAPTSMAVSGLFYDWRYDDDPEPIAPAIWAGDYVATCYLSSAIVAALYHRRETGNGQFIDLAQSETSGSLLGPTYLDISLNGESSRNGEIRQPYPDWSPNTAFRCKGSDEWCVVTVTSEEEWGALCRSIERVDAINDLRFATAQDRRSHSPELRSMIEAWTGGRTAYQAMRILQANGVPAGVVQTGEDLFRCPQLRERGFVHRMTVPLAGEVDIPGTRLQFSRTPVRFGEYKELGEANPYVFQEILGLSHADMQRLAAQHVFE